MNVFMDDLIKYKFDPILNLIDYSVENFPYFLNTDGNLLM